MNNFVTEYKINVHAEPINGLSMSQYNFECQFYVYSNKVVTIKKEDMKQNEVNGQADPDNYIAILDSEKIKSLGKGALKMRFIAHIPDSDFSDNTRTEVAEINNLNIII